MRPSVQHRACPFYRQGSVLAGVLLCLAAASALAVALLNNVRLERDSTRRYEDSVQTRWLAESGVQRAAARLAASADLDTETWTIAADQLDKRRPASIRISVSEDSTSSERKVQVTADFGDDGTRRTRFTKQITMRRERPED